MAGGTRDAPSLFRDMMELARHGPDTYVGAGPRYPWEGLYGGQIVAQALCAADVTVKPGHAPHSLHAYFLRVGDPDEPVRFEVERLRDGRTFVARQVVARQSTGAILNMSASFQVAAAPTMDVQLAEPPRVAGPESGKEVSWSQLFEMRLVEGSFQGSGEGLQSACSWFRVLEDLGSEPAVHAAALAYASDSGPAWLAGALHEVQCSPAQAWRPVSLDHAIWFHRPFRADEWLLFEASSSSLRDSRGLTNGRIFSQDGALVASVAQEVFLRRPKGPVPEGQVPEGQVPEGQVREGRRAAALLAALAVGPVALASCGQSYVGGSSVTTVPSASSATVATRSVKGLGAILVTSTGQTLYLLTSDPRGGSYCTGSCSIVWPPLITRGRLRAGPGVNPSLLSTYARGDGLRQVLYDQHALYTYDDDTGPGMVTGQGVETYGGIWRVVAPSGKAVTR